MRNLLILAMSLAASGAALGASDGYICEILAVQELSESGHAVSHKGLYKKVIGKSFSINRASGEIIGGPLSTESWRRVEIINGGSAENGYSAVIVSHPPHVSAKFVYVQEFVAQQKKPFWGMQRDLIFTGVCE